MSRRGRILVGAFVLLVSGPCVAYVGYVNFSDYRASKTYVEYHLPRGVHGWVAIRYGVHLAAPIPFAKSGSWSGVGGTYTVTIPSSQYLESSSPQPAGSIWRRERYYVDGKLIEHATDTPGPIARAGLSGACYMFYVSLDKPIPPDRDIPNTDVPGGCGR